MSITVPYPYRSTWSTSSYGLDPVALTLVTAPTAEPLSHEEVKPWARQTTDDEIQVIQSLIPSAREQCEMATDLKLMPQTWDVIYDQTPLSAAHRLNIPLAPIQSVTSVSYVDADGVTQTWSSAAYAFVPAVLPPSTRVPAFITPVYNGSYPSTRYVQRALTVRVVAGFGSNASFVPSSLKTGMLQLIATWLTTGRQSVLENMNATLVPQTTIALFGAYRAY